ncbi:MAG: flagellar motor switch protein FliG, partial [Spirochaetaceae bacterium]|nr:flagellar motor switch protein FliG [Spirochaetaceae bacterium]
MARTTPSSGGSSVGSAGGKKKGGKEFSGRQKAAIFLVSIGSDISAEIFKHLREDEIETLTFEIARLETIEPEQKDSILTEFNELMMA